MTVQQQAKLFGATHWEYKGGYVDFYNRSIFVGSTNLLSIEILGTKKGRQALATQSRRSDQDKQTTA